MANAEALFARHWKAFQRLSGTSELNSAHSAMLTIYSACIIAEAIRSDFEEAKTDIKEPHIDI